MSTFKSACDHCGCEMESDLTQRGQVVKCPGCGRHIRLPHIPPASPAPPLIHHPPMNRAAHGLGVIVLACIAGGIGLLFLIGAIGFGLQTPAERAQSKQRSTDQDAHRTAEQFIMRQYPGAQRVSAFRDSSVEHDGTRYRVAVEVNGLNAFGGPVRNAMIVEMDTMGGSWQLVQIHQR